MTIWRLLSSLHGYAGVLGVAALIHPALALRKGRLQTRRAKVSLVAATLLGVLAFGSGIAIYGAYREQVKRQLFTINMRAGLLFETKEHLAVLALSFALGACLAALLAPRTANDVRRAAALLYALAALTAAVAAGLGTYVTTVHGF
jgi:hypothetical protein